MASIRSNAMGSGKMEIRSDFSTGFARFNEDKKHGLRYRMVSMMKRPWMLGQLGKWGFLQ
ncbi:hypothetical protein MFRU_010g01740 [Monilinia fructicola]|nr:hypothetical protein MFRU_010g01740 [Monilinia fructicola]